MRAAADSGLSGINAGGIPGTEDPLALTVVVLLLVMAPGCGSVFEAGTGSVPTKQVTHENY